MQAIVSCSSVIPSLKSQFKRRAMSGFVPHKRFCLMGRRRVCFDFVSRLPLPLNIPGTDDKDGTFIGEDLILGKKAMEEDFEITTRRMLFTRLILCSSYCSLLSSNYFPALALGDPSITVEQAKPTVFPSGPLFPFEERIVQLFEKNTYSVVNIFDVNLRPQLNVNGAVEVPEGNGSGVVWDDKGHIVTNYHVGQQCLAIGNPFGFDHTLTVGVISGLNRDIYSQTGVTIGGGIQTDAAINPGNSGGPLMDSKGNLIGINTAIFTQTGTSAGVGFAIPSSTVTKIVPQLIQFGRAVRAGLDVEIAPDLIANQLNVRNGALILLVPSGSEAAKSGLLPTTRGFAGNIVLGDVIVAVDDKPVRNRTELYRTLDEYNIGDKVILNILRSDKNLEVPIILEENK